jgi:hypothetical protein
MEQVTLDVQKHFKTGTLASLTIPVLQGYCKHVMKKPGGSKLSKKDRVEMVENYIKDHGP